MPNRIAATHLAPPLRAALAQLRRAFDYAQDVQCDPWDFAIELDRLIDLGVTVTDLRWMVKKGYVDHACEITRPTDVQRRFEQCQNLAFTPASCFRLADAAVAIAEDLAVGEANAVGGVSARGAAETVLAGAKPVARSPRSSHPAVSDVPVANKPTWIPHWDADDRTLYVGHLVVKEYRVRSPNQEAVLSAFEEEGWPHYIDDPLSPVADQSPKQRLRDTIKCLNANQKNRLIRFRGDGTGERVRWEATLPPD